MVKATQSFLVKFTKTREKSFQLSKTLSLRRARSISEINKFLSLFQERPEKEVTENVYKIKTSLLEILPHEKSRFQKLRNKVLKIITP
jgi:hypothetical protein